MKYYWRNWGIFIWKQRGKGKTWLLLLNFEKLLNENQRVRVSLYLMSWVNINGKGLCHGRQHKPRRSLVPLHFSEMECLTPKGSESCITGNDHWEIVCLITWIWYLVDYVINRREFPEDFWAFQFWDSLTTLIKPILCTLYGSVS